MSTCGTYSGYQKHRRLKQDVCTACAQAARDYMTSFRRRNPDSLKQQQRQARMRNQALMILRSRHESEYDAIYAEVALGGKP